MNRAEISVLLEQAIDQLIEQEPQLLNLNVTERALSHYLALYMTMLVPDTFKVDVEYNRHFDSPKRLNLPPRKALDREVRATTVFPDIIVHKRNSDNDNLLVLELKKPGEDRTYDDLKLRAFREELGYMHTAHIILGRDGHGTLIREIIWVDG